MQKFSLYCTTGLLVLLIAGFYGCKKVNGISNGQVVETPYSLYYSDTAGTLYNTTDGGKTITKLIFPPDGFPCRAICTIGPNILWAKTNMYFSYNNGKNFNHTYDSLASYPGAGCNNLQIDVNQSMVINVPAWNRVYTLSNATPGDGTNTNYLGITFNDSLGYRGHWKLEIYYDSLRMGVLPVRMCSFTQLKNGIVCGLGYDVDMFHMRNFYKACNDAFGCGWKEVTANPDGNSNIPSFYPTGVPLPPTNAIPSASHFSLGHFNNRLIAIDGTCNNGGWYSDDSGTNWTQYQGLPTNVPLLCIASPFEEVCLVGTDSAGLYILNTNTNRFEQNNNGLGRYLKVRSIAFKENIFKNSTIQKYVYLATDQGMYQSTDGGHNWIKTIPGNYVATY